MSNWVVQDTLQKRSLKVQVQGSALLATFQLLGSSPVFFDVRPLASQTDPNYCKNRRVQFGARNQKYLQFFEDEIQNKSDIVSSILLSRAGQVPQKFMARKLQLRSVAQKEAIEFLDKNHLMGHKQGKNIGLYQEQKLVSLLTFRQFEDKVLIERFASQLNTSVAGGFGKLVSYLKQFDLPIVSFCDLRYSDGHSYEMLGFIQVGDTLGWNWTNGHQRFNRLACRASVDRTEKENARDRGWFKVYDAGQRKYVLSVSPYS